jgi:hypothetical protein
VAATVASGTNRASTTFSLRGNLKVRRIAMPMLLGMILGALLTIAGALTYDTLSGRAPNGLPPSAVGGRPPMVNWDVVSDNWRSLQVNLRELGADIERGWKRVAG